MKELSSEVAGGGKDSQQTQPKTKNPIVRTGRLVLSEQQSGSSVQKIENVSNLIAKAPMKESGDLFSSCVPVSVKRLDQDKDADENVDADHVRTVRPVESEQSIDLFTQLEDIDIDFRVSGSPHAVVKQAENFRVRELVKKIESHPHRRALQARAMRNNSKKCGAQNAFFLGIKELSIAFVDISWKKVKPANIFINGDWTLSQSRTTSSRRSDLVVLGTAKLKHRKSIS